MRARLNPLGGALAGFENSPRGRFASIQAMTDIDRSKLISASITDRRFVFLAFVTAVGTIVSKAHLGYDFPASAILSDDYADLNKSIHNASGDWAMTGYRFRNYRIPCRHSNHRGGAAVT